MFILNLLHFWLLSHIRPGTWMGWTLCPTRPTPRIFCPGHFIAPVFCTSNCQVHGFVIYKQVHLRWQFRQQVIDKQNKNQNRTQNWALSDSRGYRDRFWFLTIKYHRLGLFSQEDTDPGLYGVSDSILVELPEEFGIINWAVTCDFKQCGSLTCVDSDQPVQPLVKLRNSKCCLVSSLTVIEYSSN